jgi:regulator of protease activity HflC (stomatin/prohibitin superfamily)
MPFVKRVLAPSERAVVVRPGREPQLIGGPGPVWVFRRWKRVIVVDTSPFPVEVMDNDVVASDGVALALKGSATAQVLDPVAAAIQIADYRRAT